MDLAPSPFLTPIGQNFHNDTMLTYPNGLLVAVKSGTSWWIWRSKKQNWNWLKVWLSQPTEMQVIERIPKPSPIIGSKRKSDSSPTLPVFRGSIKPRTLTGKHPKPFGFACLFLAWPWLFGVFGPLSTTTFLPTSAPKLKIFTLKIPEHPSNFPLSQFAMPTGYIVETCLTWWSNVIR